MARYEQMQIEKIHSSLENGQRKQAVKQIEEYGCYDFWPDYKDFLEDYCYSEHDSYDYFTDLTISYFRIKNR